MTQSGIRHIRRFFLLGVLIAIVMSPALYMGNYAGDSQVHLIYGENAAINGPHGAAYMLRNSDQYH